MKKKFIMFFAVMAMLFCLPIIAQAASNGTYGNNLTWTLDDDGTLTISGMGDMENYSPSSEIGYSRSPFYNNSSIKSVIIENGITSIGASAFFGCSGLTSVTIPDGVTSIGGFSFYKCNGLTSITIPDGVTSIGQYAFYNCSGLTSITIPDSVTEISVCAFESCSSLRSVTIPGSVASIGREAFYGCSSLTNATIGDGVTRIGYYMFDGCSSLKSVTIPDSVTNIFESAFNDCNRLKDVHYNGTLNEFLKIPIGPNNTPLDNAIIYCTDNAYAGWGTCGDNVSWTLYADGTLIISGTGDMKDYSSSNYFSSDSPFYNNSSIKSVIIENGVTSVGSYAFYDCDGVTSVTIGNDVTSIGRSAFSGCSSLTSITIPDDVTSVSDYVFNGCKGLTSVTIGNGVTSIGDDAFYNCSGLTTVYYNAANCTSMGSSSYPAFKMCTALKEVYIGDNVKTIPSYAFYGCSGLTSVTIPDSVTSIGDSAFYGCTGLKDVYADEKLITDLIIPDTPNPSAKPTAAPETTDNLTVSNNGEIIIAVNGSTVSFPDEKPFIDSNGRTQVPVRAVAEMLNCEVNWDGRISTAIIIGNGKLITIAIDSNIITVNGVDTYMDTTAMLKDGRTCVPLRAIAEALGLTVRYETV